MHPEEAALLQAVCAAPDDDLPRLVFADWLNEHAQHLRAEFIRTQIELAKLTEDSTRRRKLAFRCRELMDTEEVQSGNPPWMSGFDRWHRGFVEASEVNGDDLDDRFAETFRYVPRRRLWLNGLFGVEQLCHIPDSNQLTSLDLVGNALDATELIHLANRIGRFKHLTELGLMCSGMSGRYVVDVLSDLFGHLTVLRVGGNPWRDADRQSLRHHFERRVSFTCERDADHLYAFQDDEYHFLVGLGKHDTQVMVNLTRYQFRLGVFDHNGRLLETRISNVPDQSTADAWLAEFAVRPAPIRVQRFKFPDGVGIEDFTRRQIEEMESPEPDERYWLGRWLADGTFRWKLGEMPGDDWWLNREGEVTDT